MRIDPATGNLHFDDPKFSVGPETKRVDFLLSEIGSNSKDNVIIEPWHSWRLPIFRVPASVSVTLYFCSEQLSAIEIHEVHDSFGTSWSDYNDANERARKKAHDDLIHTAGAHIGDYEWGQIYSVFGPESPWAGISNIAIRYGPKPADQWRGFLTTYAIICATISGLCVWAIWTAFRH